MSKHFEVHDAQRSLLDAVTTIADDEMHCIYRKGNKIFISNTRNGEVWGEWFVNILKGEH